MSKTLLLVLTLLGGFRGIVSEVIWFRMDRLQDEGRYAELAQLASVLAELEPKAPEVWTYAAWNLAYNVSVMMPTHADRWRWVEAGLKLLRDDGLRVNPNEPALYREIAWLFLAKIGGTADVAAPLYAREWRARIEEARRTDGWRKLAMEPATMCAIEAAYGKLDWTDPKASALYFAEVGVRLADRLEADRPSVAKERFTLHQVRYQTLMAMSLEDAAKAPVALAAMRETYTRFPSPALKELILRYRAKFNLR